MIPEFNEQTFRSSVRYWTKKLVAISHQLKSTKKYAGQLEHEYEKILANYMSVIEELMHISKD